MRKHLFERILFAILFILAAFGLKAQTVDYNQTFTNDTTLNVNSRFNGLCSRLDLNAIITHNSDSSLVRIIMTDSHGIRRLVYESYPLICNGLTDSIVSTSEETKYMPYNTNPESLEIIIRNAELNFQYIVYSNRIYKNTTLQSNNHKILVETNKTDQMNINLANRGLLWRAKQNEYSSFSFQEKTDIWGGEDYNLEGYDYYGGGIFSEYSKHNDYSSFTEFTRSTNGEQYVKTTHFDWREKHNAHIPYTPYWDYDLDYFTYWTSQGQDTIFEHGNGWLTSVKDQTVKMPGEDSIRCPDGCYTFAVTSTFEAALNLYANQHINRDVSEQHMIECNYLYDGSSSCLPGDGGRILPSFINTSGYCFVDENTFPWIDFMDLNNPVCQSNVYAIYRLKPGQMNEVITTKKNLMTYGPMATQPRKGHICTLVGFRKVMVGDTLRTNDGWGQDQIIIPESHPYIGRTAWIFKDSRGPTDMENGYITKLAEDDGLPFGGSSYVFTDSIGYTSGGTYIPITQSYFDYDGDGYWNWGTGPKPANCPGPEQSTAMTMTL